VWRIRATPADRRPQARSFEYAFAASKAAAHRQPVDGLTYIFVGGGGP